MSRQTTPKADAFANRWKKSTRSKGENACIEVASAPDLAGVRDSKQRGRGPILAFDQELWRSFIGRLKAGGFDRP